MLLLNKFAEIFFTSDAKVFTGSDIKKISANLFQPMILMNLFNHVTAHLNRIYVLNQLQFFMLPK